MDRNLTSTKDFKFKKSLGQNFLFDKNILNKIIKTANINRDSNILEIGVGSGNLTRYILAERPFQYVGYEKDNNLKEVNANLLDQFSNSHGDNNENQKTQSKIIYKDIMKVGFEEILENFGISNTTKKITLVANLPYNIGSTLLINFAKNAKYFEKIIVMLQNEVVDRVVANEKTDKKNFSFLSVALQTVFDVKKEFLVQRNCFIPQPAVCSAIVSMQPIQTLDSRVKLDFERRNFLLTFYKAAFAQRRKKILVLCKKFGLDKFLSESELSCRIEDLPLSRVVDVCISVFDENNI